MLVKLKDQSSFELPEGSTAKDLADKLNLKGPNQALGANINGKTVDLSYPSKMGTRSLSGISMILKAKKFSGTPSAHVLAQAILRLWPEAEAHNWSAY